VVRDVAGDDVSDRPDRSRIVTRDARSIPRLLRHALEEGNRRKAHDSELVDEVGPRCIVRVGVLDCDILVETRQRVIKSARKPERPARKHPLTVVYVVQDLANGPLPRRVSMKALLLADPAQKLEHLAHLVLHCGHDVVAGYKVDVPEIVVGGFVCVRSCHLAENPNKNR